jgi:transposase
MIIEGATTAAVFEQYIEQILAPALTAGQIVIMDNLSCHKGEKIRLLIEARGCQVLFLPTYSPDLSPTRVGLFQTQSVPAASRGPDS